MRGEILLPWTEFERLNAEREQNEEPLFANPRNAASGTLKLQNAAEVSRRRLDANEGRANASWGRGDEFASNCQAAVAVHEARLRGLNVTALGYDGTRGSTTYELGEHFEAIWQHPKTGKTPTPTTLRADSFDAMISKVDAQTKAAGRYHIGINMSEDRGHVITAERLPDGRIFFYDAQDGAFLKLEEYAVSNVEYLEVLKVDKLLLRPDIFRQIARLL